MIKRKFNYKKFIIFCLFVIAVIIGIVIGISKLVEDSKYKKTYEYKFISIGYSLDEFKILENELNNKQLDNILKMKYNKHIDNFVKEKYFLYKNLDKYIEYKSENGNLEYSEIVRIINTLANVDWFDNSKDTDISYKELMLVNRIYGLSSDYVPEDIIDIPLKYAYSGNKISESIMNNIINLIDDAQNSGYTFVVSSGYRSYSDQEKLYNNYASSYGKNDADKLVAKPGHSDYQTGLSFDLQPYNKVFEDAYESDEYKWLKSNAHYHGFIFRLPKDSENITRFNSSVWRLRYVGEEAAKTMYIENITLEEYYAYYVVGEKDE